jgi:hypothetical protein
MKPIITSSFLGTCLLLSMIATPSLAAPKSYTMVCKGGGDMLASIFNAQHATLEIRFKKANTGSAKKPPAPGQCAWLDRGFRAEEPAKLRYRGKDNPFLSLKAKSSGISIDRWGKGPAATLIQAVISRREFIVQAYFYKKDNRFIITRVGP